MLGAVVLTLGHGVGRQVGNTYRRFRPVNVLTTRSRGAVYVDTQVGRVNLDFDVVVDFWRDKYGRERGMTTVAGVERALTHQTMYTGFGTQPAIGVFALNVNGGTFDARDFTFRDFHQLAFEAMSFDPAQVHTQQHVGPVLSFGTTGAGLNFHVGVVFVHFAREHAAEFEHFQLGLQFVQFGDDVIHCTFITFFNSHIQQVFVIRQTFIKVIDGVDHGFQCGTFAAEFLGAFGVIPDIALGQFVFYFFETLNFVGVVKDTPSARQYALKGL